MTNTELPKTRPPLGEIFNCPRSCTEKLKITLRHSKGVIYTNCNTYWVILGAFRHPQRLKRPYFVPKIALLGHFLRKNSWPSLIPGFPQAPLLKIFKTDPIDNVQLVQSWSKVKKSNFLGIQSDKHRFAKNKTATGRNFQLPQMMH